MSRITPVERAIRLLSIIERNANGLRVTEMAEQLGAPPRAVYRDLQVLDALRVPLIGHCHLRKDIRTFVVDRMQKIKMTEESFPAPVGFFLENYLRHSFGMFREDLVRVKVRFHKSITRYLLERRWHPSQKHKKLKEGSLELAFEVAGTKEIKTWVAGFGSLAKVLEPASLVKEIKDDLGKALRSYAKT